jgi:hypothetical protein
MQQEDESVSSGFQLKRGRLYALLQEAEDIRSQLLDVCSLAETSSISTRLPSGVVTRSQSPAPTLNGYDLMNSPVASTIHLGTSGRKSTLNRSAFPISSELERISARIVSSVHRKALIAIDRYGVDAIKWRRGFTALHWAYREGLHEVVEYLIGRGADEEAVDDCGKKPADYSKKNMKVLRLGLVELVDLASLPLPQRRALEAMDQYGWESLKWGGGYTILHWAYQSQRGDVIAYCRSIGFPFSIRDAKGKLPQDYASKR